MDKTHYLVKTYAEEITRLKHQHTLELQAAVAKATRKYIPVQVKISALIISLINTSLFFYTFTAFSRSAIFWGTLTFAIIGSAGITYSHPFADIYKTHVRKFGSTYLWPRGKVPKWAIIKR